MRRRQTPFRSARTLVHFAVLVALLLDPVVIGWLVFTPRPVARTILAAGASLLIFPILAGIKIILDLAISGKVPEDEFDNLHFTRLLQNYRAAREQGTGER